MSAAFDKYKKMKLSGFSPEDVYREAVGDQVDSITGIRMIREVFSLSLPEAKEVIIKAEGESQSLDQYQEKIADELIRNLSKETI